MSSNTPMAATPCDHDLKVQPVFFGPLCDGTKPFELRKNDRDYKVGDVLRLREFDPATQSYTGTVCERRVSYVLANAADFGLKDGYAVLGLLEPAVTEQGEGGEMSAKPGPFMQKYCPLLSIAQHANPLCLMHNCAWWSEMHQCCAVLRPLIPLHSDELHPGEVS